MKISQNYLKCFLILLVACLNLTVFAQDQVYTTIYLGTTIDEWSTEGNVSYSTIDSTLGFIFSFDENNPPQSRPDTVTLDLIPSIDLVSCDSAFIYFDTRDQLPDPESWVIATIRTFIKHENNSYWTEIYDRDLSHLAGWVQQLNIRFTVAVRTDQNIPGEFMIYNIKIQGNCSP